jgi:hypothetical protein
MRKETHKQARVIVFCEGPMDKLRHKLEWLRMRMEMVNTRPVDTATHGDEYAIWYADYCRTDKLDPLPNCQPGTALWREMISL